MRGGSAAVVAGLLSGLLAVFVALDALNPVGLRISMASDDSVETLFQALLTTIITGVMIVVTINQLVHSQELDAVGDQRERREGAMTFRREVEDVLDDPVAPVEPAAFLRALLETTRERPGR